MKTWLSIILLLQLEIAYAINLGDEFKSETLLGHRGEEVDLSQYKGKTVVLEWFNEGCPFVRKHYDSMNMQSLQKKYASEVVWLTIVSSRKGEQGYLKDSNEAMATYVREKMASSHLLLDPTGKFGQYHGAKTTPHMFVFNKGKLAYTGAIDNFPTTNVADIQKATNYVEKIIEAIKTGKEVPAGQVKPYGCSVKY
ncbi:MAG: hypothetical protein A2381_14865 [Bdellovibrionales bacterium RIFOXYB1_FULL_37_110]|nr:MAG: hypothetical protein A2417_10370 [Bdellovibrionales bacterium RIFOXYC1_FULL_37_79]OFZ60146.1 MAG: hypothetical protein A2381_14865 [Bdellovibrionales bacterium RIFOXYB1_FULL_37_110]OFZ64360.1 MAG: hypothetical protein A2577_09905 [Bdellovibrionales bacterium RIFOXYD1_FULL_36_51]